MPRYNSWLILNAFEEENMKTLDQIFENNFNNNIKLSKRDRDLLNNIVYGVIRWKSFLDWLISYFSKTPIKKIDIKVLNILRLGLFQIVFLDRIPDSAAVNTSVEIAKLYAKPYIVRFVNGLLRNIIRGYKNISFPDMEKDRIKALSILKSFPQWLIKRWIERFGFMQTESLCDSINIIPPISLRVNKLKTNREDLKLIIKEDAEKIFPTIYSSDGIKILGINKAIFEFESFEKGLFQVQDEASQLVTLLLDPKPFENVLDACCGLGGKTGHIAQCMENKGVIAAVDKDSKKIEKLNKEMKRLGISIADTYKIDLYNEINLLPLNKFDRILLDAPCSGLGVIRRNPDIKWKSSKENLSSFYKKQIKLLSNIARLVKTNGILVYSVCSTEPEENEMVADEFLKNNPNFKIDVSKGKLFDKPYLFNDKGYLKIYPHIHDSDGFFAVRFLKV